MIKRIVFCIAWLILLMGGHGIETDDVFNKHSLLPITTAPKKDSTTVIVAAPDGSIYLVDAKSRKIIWSFASGEPIYSSYQSLPDHEIDDDDDEDRASEISDFFINIGDDWELYANGHGYEKRKLPLSIEELIKSTPIISSDGGVLLGSKNTTVFLVDAKSGKIIYPFRSDDRSAIKIQKAENNPLILRDGSEDIGPPSSMNSEKVEQFLYITRKDYSLKYISHKTGKELWNLKFADIDASFRCQDAGNYLEKNGKMEIDNKFPSQCQGNAVVYRIRDQRSLERLFRSDGLLSSHPGYRMPSLPSTELALLLQFPKNLPKEILINEDNKNNPMLALPSGERENTGILRLPSGDADEAYKIVNSEFFFGSRMWYLVAVGAVLSCIFVLASHFWNLIFGKKNKLNKQEEESKTQGILPKKKKSRKMGNNKNSIGIENLPIDSIRFSDIGVGDKDGRKIGSMLIKNKEIAKGSNGTIVYEGIYDGRPVAIKRLVRSHHEVALKEVQNLIASDCHPNIVRLYGIEYDQDFVYLSLELCNCSLFDLIYLYSDSSQNHIQNISDRTIILESLISSNKEFQLWKANGYPSAQLLNIMRDIVSGVAHLHELGIIHRDLKPQNVLIIKQGSVRAKVSDMGISKSLPADMSSLTENITGGGSSGWQAPEQLRHERQTRSVDLFSLGCLLFFCLTGGQNPFGDGYERDANIVKNQKDLFLIEHNPEAVDLISRLLDPNPSLRPKAVDVLHHPLFWDAEMRLSFLRDASDRVELEDREINSDLLKALENTFPVALRGKWDEKMDNAFINDIGRYRRYKFDSVRDLLRVIRNKLNHYRELTQEIREILGQLPEGFNDYFSSRFPGLLIEVYKIIYIYCREEEFLSKYFKSKQT